MRRSAEGSGRRIATIAHLFSAAGRALGLRDGIWRGSRIDMELRKIELRKDA